MALCRSSLLLALTASSLLAGIARAHNGQVHRDLVEYSYEAIKAVAWDYNRSHGLPDETSFGPPRDTVVFEFSTPPEGIAPEAWEAFRASLAAAYPRMHAWQSGLPKPRGTFCTPSYSIYAGYPEATLGQLGVAPGLDYLTGDNCGIDLDFSPGGIFTGYEHPGNIARVDSTGMALGLWAQNIDYDADDTHVWYRPSSAGFVGLGKAAADNAVKAGLTAALVPVVCLVKFFLGDIDDCVKAAKAIADKADPIDKLPDPIPGVGEQSGGDYVTVWHFLNVQGGVSNFYDDLQGLFYEEAGLMRVPDALDLGIIIATDFSGLSIRYDTSLGPKRYEVVTDDGHPNTNTRSGNQWDFRTVGHTVFSPLDNLAFYGWNRFRTEARNAQFLGWPLHALGDATAPHHLIGSTGWGHRPFEDAVAQQWMAVRYIDDPVHHPQGDIQKQREQLDRVLATAFRYRQLIAAARSAHPERGPDVPLRDFVTQVARETFDEVQRSGPWPFDQGASTGYLVGDKGAATSLYTPDTDRMRPLLERGLGAMVAFLASASEVP